ncbi:hypothetical protein [Sphingopyxis sp. USTB-05]|uniref:hypothetical protein n=1 Tax=Sphingopyxis sp. USTB-05 TaxID=2830667 RepID=UPI002078A165|nr:hypothetical protein [Sphingopyxis sp. USTB-05]USI77607.1 hypothetical protein KEC45_01440 [Sphingopyxis sp. USTB-05]
MAYLHTLYVDGLISPETFNTMPPQTLDAFRTRGTVAETLTGGIAGARRQLAEAELAKVRAAADFIDDVIDRHKAKF